MFDDEFGLSPAGADYADVAVWVCERVMQQERAYDVAFSCLPCPACGYELAVLELADEFRLIGGWCETECFLAELEWVGGESVLFHLGRFLFELLEFPC